jgi:hypothetical protein
LDCTSFGWRLHETQIKRNIFQAVRNEIKVRRKNSKYLAQISEPISLGKPVFSTSWSGGAAEPPESAKKRHRGGRCRRALARTISSLRRSQKFIDRSWRWNLIFRKHRKENRYGEIQNSR